MTKLIVRICIDIWVQVFKRLIISPLFFLQEDWNTCLWLCITRLANENVCYWFVSFFRGIWTIASALCRSLLLKLCKYHHCHCSNVTHWHCVNIIHWHCTNIIHWHYVQILSIDITYKYYPQILCKYHPLTLCNIIHWHCANVIHWHCVQI